MSRVSIIIVNFRAWRLAADCLESLAGEADRLPGLRVRVVDSASGDDSVAQLSGLIARRSWTWASVMPLTRNGGFACGNNAAVRDELRRADPPDHLMLLNPDTVAKPGAVGELSRFLEQHPRAGIAGSSLLNAQGGRESAAHRDFSPWTELDDGARLGLLTRLLARHALTLPVSDHPLRCDWVSGASMMVRREVFQRIGLMDEGYFLYFDEVDFCRRARLDGWEVWHVPASTVVHLEGASTLIKAEARRRPGYWFESRRRYFVKAWGVTGLIWADLLWAIGRMTLAARRALRLGGSFEGIPPRFAWDLLAGDVRAMLDGQVAAIRRGDERHE
jgi:hypothetical protein